MKYGLKAVAQPTRQKAELKMLRFIGSDQD